MSILLNKSNKIIVQGITGSVGSRVCADMLAYGTAVAGGVAPGKGGSKHLGVTIYDEVAEAVKETGADSSLVMVPGLFAKEAIFEAIDAGIRLIVCPGEGIPIHDIIKIKRRLKETGSVLVGGNSPGIISPGVGKMGFMPAYCYRPGAVGVISKSGSLSYEVSKGISDAGFGQSTVVGIGGDAIRGLSFVDVLKLFQNDAQTEAVVLLGEIGGNAEIKAAEYIKSDFKKPVISYLTGRTAPPGQKMGHAGAILNSSAEGYESKVRYLTDAGATVVEKPWEIPAALAKVMKGNS